MSGLSKGFDVEDVSDAEIILAVRGTAQLWEVFWKVRNVPS